jgi:hypothetical protein
MFMARHAFWCCGLMFFIALRALVRIYMVLTEEPTAVDRAPVLGGASLWRSARNRGSLSTST